MDGLVSGTAALRGLSGDEARVRARRLRAVLTDCDGVLTDGSVYLSAAGEELLRFSRRDGMGFERLHAAGLFTAIVTREASPIVARRADKLGARLHAGVRDKRAWLDAFLTESGLRADELAYLGDDVNDLPLIEAVLPTGLCAAPADAEPPVRARVHAVTSRPGGAGAFRDLAELLLTLREERP